MVESDQSDRETQDEMPALEVSNDSIDNNELTQKRIREETSEDEKLHLPAKKLCTFVDKTVSEEHKTERNPEVNNIVEDVNEYTNNMNASDNKEDIKCSSMMEESIGSDTKESHDLNSENENEELCINTDNKIQTMAKPENVTDSEQKVINYRCILNFNLINQTHIKSMLIFETLLCCNNFSLSLFKRRIYLQNLRQMLIQKM